jgi:hypothetical protein
MPAFRKREKRVGLHLPVEVSGTDASGATFLEKTRTRNVSGAGCCFEGTRHLVVGCRLNLSIHLPGPLRRHFGGRAIYRVRSVVCRVERMEGESFARIGVRFLGEA